MMQEAFNATNINTNSNLSKDRNRKITWDELGIDVCSK